MAKRAIFIIVSVFILINISYAQSEDDSRNDRVDVRIGFNNVLLLHSPTFNSNFFGRGLFIESELISDFYLVFAYSSISVHKKSHSSSRFPFRILETREFSVIIRYRMGAQRLSYFPALGLVDWDGEGVGILAGAGLDYNFYRNFDVGLLVEFENIRSIGFWGKNHSVSFWNMGLSVSYNFQTIPK